jgi:hypothetical protein
MIKEILLMITVLMIVSCAAQRAVDVPARPSAPPSPIPPTAEPSIPAADTTTPVPAEVQNVTSDVDNLTSDLDDLEIDIDPNMSSFEDW